MIAAVTNYYNPSRNPVKLANYDRFRSRITNLPLYTIEVAFGNQQFQLPKDKNTIQIRTRDIIWQQYRLVNRVIEWLPDKFDKVVWIDADILFEKLDWHEKLSSLLDDYKVVQNYSSVDLLSKENGKSQNKVGVVKNALEKGKLDLSATYATGFTWGLQREVVEKCKIYNYWITGSDDIALIIALWGDFKNDFLTPLNENMRKHYLEWAIMFHEYTCDTVSYVNQKVYHLWHGHRNYRKRWICLQDFNPYTDVEVGEDGCLRWCSDKPKLHECCKNMCLNYDVEFNPFL